MQAESPLAGKVVSFRIESCVLYEESSNEIQGSNQVRSRIGLSEEEIEKLLDYFCLQSEHQKIHFLWRPHLPDPNDDHILELAVASGASLIVTHNTKDFKRIGDFGIRPITPKKLLEKIV